MIYNPDEFPALVQEAEDFMTANAVDDQTRYMARKYYPTSWGHSSAHLGGGTVNSFQALMLHAKGEEDARPARARLEERERRNAKTKAKAADAEKSSAWVQWHQECTARKAVIEQKNAEWRSRVAAMQKAVSDWKQYVEAARADYQAAKLVPVPPQPPA